MLEARKQEEQKLHDLLRGKAKKESYYASNLKFYSITRSSRNFINNWLLSRVKGKKVLDYCCGNGGMALWLAENGADAYGIDISSISIQNAQDEANRKGLENKVHFFVMDAEAMEFNNDFFDIICCMGVLHHLDLNKAYPELARVLKPDGVIICNEPLKYNPVFQLYRRLTPHLRTKWEIEHILKKKDINLAKRWFGKVEILGFFHLFTLLAVPLRNLSEFGRVLSFLEAIDSIILKLPFLKYLAWQVIFTLSQPKKI
jgi:ubiquinone/menaquinone biosynthesis C-methylase UbiE